MIIYRALRNLDATLYRDFRINALEIDGHWFTTDLEQERAKTLSDWQHVCTETTSHVILAAFDNNIIVGAVEIERHDYHIAKWKSAYVSKHMRHTGVLKTLTDMCEEWCAEHGHYEALLTIRADNLRTIGIIEKHGASCIKTEPMRFADGTTALVHWYRKPLVGSLIAA